MLTAKDKRRAEEYAETSLEASGRKTYSASDRVRRTAFEYACRVKNEEFLEILQFVLAITSGFEVNFEPLEYIARFSDKEERDKILKQLGIEKQYEKYDTEIKEVIAKVKDKTVITKYP
jgi:hypothetical protein